MELRSKVRGDIKLSFEIPMHVLLDISDLVRIQIGFDKKLSLLGWPDLMLPNVRNLADD